MSTLTKADIVEALYAGNALENATLSDAKNVVEELFDLMRKAIVEDHSLLISGFGRFEAYEKHQRRGRNPKTNEAMVLDGRTVCVFRLSRNFRNELNAGDRA